MSHNDERESWSLADQLIEAGRRVYQRFGGVERVIECIRISSSHQPEGYRAGIQQRIELERRGNLSRVRKTPGRCRQQVA